MTAVASETASESIRILDQVLTEITTTDLSDVDIERVRSAVLGGHVPGADAADLRELAIHAAAELINADPQYSTLAARLLAAQLRAEASGAGAVDFPGSVAAAHAAGLISQYTARFVAGHAAELAALLDPAADDRFDYLGLCTIRDRYLLRHPETNTTLEAPQHFLLRVACGLAETVADVAELYRLMNRLAYLPSSATLVNAGTRHPQLAAHFLLDSPRDELDAIYQRYGEVARLSRHAGGIGLSFSRVRSRGSLINGTNGRSSGIAPWLRMFDASVAAVHQGDRATSTARVYLEPWHADVLEFLRLREEPDGTPNLELALWLPDEFMRRVEADRPWSLFDPKHVPDLVDRWGADFDRTYRAAEAAGRARDTLPARQLYAAMLRSGAALAFKDTANRTSNQTQQPRNVVHLAGLSTETIAVTADTATAVGNAGSVNLAAHLADGDLDWSALAGTVRAAVRLLDRTLDLSYYPTGSAAGSNQRWRPIGLGVFGLADVFLALRLPFDSAEALALSTRIAEEVALVAHETSAELAARHGAHPAFADTRAATGVLHPDHYPNRTVRHTQRWAALHERIARHGLRNSLLVAIAPANTPATIAGRTPGIEPPVSNVDESGRVNPFLVAELKRLGHWTAESRRAIRTAEGSVRDLAGLPPASRLLFRTAWELPQRALIELAAARTPYVDQGQAVNLFRPAPTLGELSSLYTHAWRSGLKTTYRLRSRSSTVEGGHVEGEHVRR
ncbi:MAG TPA: ribonucleoside-diphosphate reductase subunit alpha [Pseudonocardiaceae bacterium]|nr:ribonucleoside-diphosphate reductase subunit alpha [Pseudonocardiaceae bacterium]